MLWWSEPRWVTDAKDVYAARWKWYRETLIAAYNTYGLKFDYVSATRNERAADSEWIKYLSARLKSEAQAPYDFSAIKLVAGDEVGTWKVSADMLADKELLKVIDVVGSHYTSWSDSNTRKLQDEYGKEVWFSEGSAPMNYSQGAFRYDGTGSGISDINGILDIADRIITMYPGGGMTLYEFQPAAAAYYDGVTYCQKQLILASEPWSGYYTLDSGYYMALHFARFIKKGWAFVESACAADGRPGGDGHSVVGSTYSYLTACDPETGDLSTVVTNTTDSDILYSFRVSGGRADSPVYLWETRGPDTGVWNRRVQTISPENGSFTVTVKPYSIVTLTTLDKQRGEFPEYHSGILRLPYTDDFEYPDQWLKARGSAPLYTTDEGGAFEVTEQDGNRVLMQKITEATHAVEWEKTPPPVTNFGDDRWFNYSVSAEVLFPETDEPEKVYAGIGLRYNLADDGASGWNMLLYADGKLEMRFGNRVLARRDREEIPLRKGWNTIKIEARNDIVRCCVNGEFAASYGENGNVQLRQPAGRAALYSSCHRNCFRDLKVEPSGGDGTYINRLDDTDESISYSGSWKHSTMDSFRNYKRTLSSGEAGASFTVAFDGTGILLTGVSGGDAVIDTVLDGKARGSAFSVPETGNRQAFYSLYGLENARHTLTVTIKEGTLSLDAAEIVITDRPAPAVTQ